jgi:hypothetical protein
MLSGLLLAGMSMDRLLAVIKPMKALTICTASRAKKLVAITAVFVVVSNISLFFTIRYATDTEGRYDHVTACRKGTNRPIRIGGFTFKPIMTTANILYSPFEPST